MKVATAQRQAIFLLLIIIAWLCFVIYFLIISEREESNYYFYEFFDQYVSEKFKYICTLNTNFLNTECRHYVEQQTQSCIIAFRISEKDCGIMHPPSLYLNEFFCLCISVLNVLLLTYTLCCRSGEEAREASGKELWEPGWEPLL